MNFETPEEAIRAAGGTTEAHRPFRNGDGSQKAGHSAAPDPSTNSTTEIWDAGDDDYVIPPRAWLLGTTFCRRFLSSLIADGGVGKTAVRIAQLISLAIFRPLTGEHVHRRCRVLIVSLEDDKDELRRRVFAVMRHHGVTRRDVKGWLFLAAPKGLRLAEMKDGTPQAGVLKTWLDDAIELLKPDVVSIDPFIKSHGMEENSNGAIDFVCTMLSMLAIQHDLAIDLPHHTNKGISVAGDANRGRGASSMKDAARLVYTLTPMTPEEGQQFGCGEAERRSLIRVDSGKVNIAPPSSEAKWFQIVGVPLDNATKDYPRGDNVQTVVPWTPPNLWDGLDLTVLNDILSDIEAGLPDGVRYSPSARQDVDRAAWRVVQKHGGDKTAEQAQKIVSAWLKTGLLVSKDYDDPVQRHPRKGLFVDATKRPGNAF